MDAIAGNGSVDTNTAGTDERIRSKAMCVCNFQKQSGSTAATCVEFFHARRRPASVRNTRTAQVNDGVYFFERSLIDRVVRYVPHKTCHTFFLTRSAAQPAHRMTAREKCMSEFLAYKAATAGNEDDRHAPKEQRSALFSSGSTDR